MSKKNKKEIKNFWRLCSLAIFLLFFGAIFQINSQIHQNSLLSGCQKNIASISAENDELEVALSRTNSLDNFARYQIDQIGNYEKVDLARVRYVRAPAGELARK